MHPDHLLQIIELRHTLHRHPDLSMQETGTAEILRRFLAENTSLEICVRDGWFYAVKRGRKSRNGAALSPDPGCRRKAEGAPAVHGAGRRVHNLSGCSKGAPAGHRAGDSEAAMPAGPGTGDSAEAASAGGPAAAMPAESGASASETAAAPIAFRADMDALPIPETIGLPYASVHAGISHKCGHDGHCAALCGLALELDGRETERDVYLLFQPGEETGEGALRCRALLREKGIGEIYAFHNLGGYPEGQVVYRRGLTQPASEGLRIRFRGAASHASAPEKGKNPARALAEVVRFAQQWAAAGDGSADAPENAGQTVSFSTRGPAAGTALSTEEGPGTAADIKIAGQTAPGERDGGACSGPIQAPMRLCTVTGLSLGSGDFGISPGEGELCLTLRAEEEADLHAMQEAVTAFAREAAARDGLEVTSSVHDVFPETRNHDVCLDRVLEAAARQKPAVPMRELWRASEDFGYYLKECPGAMFYIGNGEDHPALHTAGYDFNDRILETAVDLFLALVRLFRRSPTGSTHE